MGLSTHVLDLVTGAPVANLSIRLFRGDNDIISQHVTDDDGRCGDMLNGATLASGNYRLDFDVAPYFKASETPCFYDVIPIVFCIDDTEHHYHVPLLLSPFGYSTYRGS